MQKKIYLTLDLEQDYGTALNANFYHALPNLEPLLDFLNEEKIPLTIFVQTKLIKENLISTNFDSFDIEIDLEPHSYSHLGQGSTNMAEEISRSIEIFDTYLNLKPIGYRFPDGNIKPEDYTLLKDHQIKYDASIFPSWRPGHFNNSKNKKEPYFTPEGILEIPFSVIGKRLPVPISLSYFKLLGKRFYKKVIKNMPNRVVFDFHLHDLTPIPKTSFKKLSLFYQMIYSKNKHKGSDFLRKFIKDCQDKNYEFDILHNYYKEFRSC